MNKRINYFAVIPFFGTFILFCWLFVKKAKKEINSKLNFYFFLCGVFGCAIYLAIAIILYSVSAYIDIEIFLECYGIPLVNIFAGLLLNLFSFLLINKKWGKLEI